MTADNPAAIREILVVSGKGGTGKTTVTASFAALGLPCVIADCDVDAADLFLITRPAREKSKTFTSGRKPVFDLTTCTRCGRCAEQCRFAALAIKGGDLVYDRFSCEGCALCSRICPSGAVAMEEKECGEWYVSSTRYGPMVHARLHVAEENSGKLVTVVRRQAKQLAEQNGMDTIYIDGPPGIGCPVISSLTGVDLAVLVTEPTLSGLHDLERIADLARQLKARTAVCVNKYDLNVEMTAKIEDYCRSGAIELVGRIPYDRSVIESLVCGEAVVHATHSEAARAIRDVWGNVLGLCRQN